METQGSTKTANYLKSVLHESISTLKVSSLVVAAVDFGTSFSGCAFALKHDLERDPTKVYALTWQFGGNLLQKTPTTLLINPDGKTFAEFGSAADDMYSQLSDAERKTWYYFRGFKMCLMKKMGPNRNIEIPDETGKMLSAKTVFSMAIKYLKDYLMAEISKHWHGIDDNDITWVLTVPAIWNDAAKQFMREAAVEAGIATNKLSIALEPEVASIFCRHLPLERMQGDINISALKEGTMYMIVDAGGGTVDITIHRVLKEGKLQEVYNASGGAWGGISVDMKYRQLLVSIFGGSIFETFVHKNLEDYLEMTRKFEILKKSVVPNTDNQFKIRIPLSLREIIKQETHNSLEEAITQSNFSSVITVDRDKLVIKAGVMRDLFDETLRSITKHVKMLMAKPFARDLSRILMVGGFSESKMLQEEIRKMFPNMKIAVPKEADVIVLKGAVSFGCNPSVITERIAKFSYGVAEDRLFIEGQDDMCKRYESHDGTVMCKDAFRKHVEIGQTIKVNEKYNIEYRPTDGRATFCTFHLFASEKKNTKYITEKECFKLGDMKVDVDIMVPFKDRQFTISLAFGGTEIHMKAFEKCSGKETTCSIDFLECPNENFSD